MDWQGIGLLNWKDFTMGNSSVDRNVLFGVLAWQLGVVEREPLTAAMYSCMTDKSKQLPDFLVAAGLLSVEDRHWLDQAVDRQLRKHGNDAGRTLADIGSVDSICRELRSIALSDSLETMDVPAAAIDRHAPTMAPQRTVHDVSTATKPSGERPAPVERFHIIRPHARGGLGEVFVAVDEELKREVALKQILAKHADNATSRTRFLLEAEVTGNLEHPGVVPVYGLGAQPDGRPYYAMRFIRGDSLEDAIRRFHKSDDDPFRDPGERALELRNLLSRFVAVCNTIEYAHSRGFVHRDIKPENIMLGPYGETLVVDWGLARPMEQQEAELVCHSDVILESAPPGVGASTGERPTQMGSVVGTPQFMSPEQAAGRLDLIRGPSDVYSLGATLYCLLTDQPAFVATDVRKVLRDVREGTFPKPRQVKRDVPLPLEAICLKAMALDPAARYVSPRGLGDDIEQWLADEPVSALPETGAERVQRWLRRHKTWARAGAATLVMIAAVAGVAYAREAGLRAEVEQALNLEAQARKDADEARTLADFNASLAEKERKRAEAHAQRAEQQSALALATLKSVLFDIQSKLKNVPAAHTVRLSMLNTVVDGLNQVARSLETAAETDHSLVRAYLDLGDIFLQVGTADGTSATADAQRMFERGAEVATKLRDAGPQNAAARADLAAAYQRMGDVGRLRGNLAIAADWFRKSLDLRKSLADENADDAQTQRDLAASVQRLGLVSEQLGDLTAAKDYYARYFELSQRLAERDPKNVEDSRNLSVSYERMGDISLLQDDAKAAEEFFQKSLEVRRALVATSENNSLAKRDMSVTLDRLGNLALDRRDSTAAEDFFRQSLELRQELYDADPNIVQSLRDVLVSYALLGDTALGQNDLQSADKYYQRYHGIAEKLVLGDPDNVQFIRDFATAFYRRGDVMLRMGNLVEAREFYRKYYQLMQQLSGSDPANAELRNDLLKVCAMLGDLSLQLSDVAEARRFFGEYLVEARSRAEQRPNDAYDARILIDALLRNGDLHVRLLDLSQAEHDLHEARLLAQKADEGPNRSAATKLSLAGAEGMLAQYELENRDPAKAADFARSGLEHLREVAATGDAEQRAQAEALLHEQRQVPARCETAAQVSADVTLAAKQPATQVPDLLDFAASAQFRRGEFDEAQKTLERLAALEPKSGGNLFAAARRYAAAAAGLDAKPGDDATATRRKKFLDRAVALLREAEAAGAFEDVVLAARLEYASDFAVLKDRKEYLEMIKQIRQRRNPLPPKTT